MNDPGLGFQIRIRLKDDRVIASERWQRRVVLRNALRLGRPHSLLCASLSPKALHLLAMCGRKEAGRLAHSLESSLRQQLRLPLGFRSQYPEAIQNPRHLRGCFRHILTANPRYDPGWDPFLEASTAPDLLEARLLGRHTREAVGCYLPRWKPQELYGWLGIKPLEPWQAPGALALEHLCEATRRAACITVLNGRRPEQRAARRAALAVAGGGGSQPESARRFGVSRRTIQRDLTRPADPRLERAIRLQLCWSLRTIEQARRQIAG